MVDGVRIYLPADNRLDFSRFLTADVAEVQIQKGYASVLDGPGAMGGAINLVTRKPTKASRGRGERLDGRPQRRRGLERLRHRSARASRSYYVQGSANYSDRDCVDALGQLSADRQLAAAAAGRRLSSDTSDSRFNVKAGWTPNQTDEYTVNFIKQLGEKGAPLNVFNNPPVPPNSYWRWPYWDIQNTSFLSRTRFGQTAYVKTKVYYNTFENGLDAFDDATYTTQSANGRFRSPYDDHAYGVSAEVGRDSCGRRTRSRGGALSRRRAHGAADQSPHASDAELAGAAAGAVAEHLVAGGGRHLSRHAGRRSRRRHQLRPLRRSRRPRSSTPRAACSSIRRAAPTAFNWQSGADLALQPAARRCTPACRIGHAFR